MTRGKVNSKTKLFAYNCGKPHLYLIPYPDNNNMRTDCGDFLVKPNIIWTKYTNYAKDLKTNY